MWFSASVFAYDAMDQVVITGRVWDDNGLGEKQMQERISCATTVSGVGQDDPREWLRDALVALIEAL